MSLDEFKLLRLRIVENVLLIEVMCTNVQGPEQAEASVESWPRRSNRKRRNRSCWTCTGLYFSSMGLAALFKLVKLAKERQRPVRFCNMDPYVPQSWPKRSASIWSSRSMIARSRPSRPSHRPEPCVPVPSAFSSNSSHGRWQGSPRHLRRVERVERTGIAVPAVSFEADAVDDPNSSVAKRLGSQGNARARQIPLSRAGCSSSERVTYQGQHADESPVVP